MMPSDQNLEHWKSLKIVLQVDATLFLEIQKFRLSPVKFKDVGQITPPRESCDVFNCK